MIREFGEGILRALCYGACLVPFLAYAYFATGGFGGTGSVEDDYTRPTLEEMKVEPEDLPAPKRYWHDDTYYENCDEVRAAGAAPLYQGERGYASHLDADRDGVACEPWGGH